MTTTAEWLDFYQKAESEGLCAAGPVTVANLQRLTEVHLRRYERMLDDAKTNPRNFRAPELRELLTVWGEVKAKEYVFADLSERARSEVHDAVCSGE